MAAKRISQREARRLRRELTELRQQIDHERNTWRSDWPNATHLRAFEAPPLVYEAVRVARELGHAVIVIPYRDEPGLRLWAVRLPESAS